MGNEASPLIDRFLPEYDTNESHSLEVRASAQQVWQAIHEANLARALPVRLLLMLRAAPAALASGPAGWRKAFALGTHSIRLEVFRQHRFALLAENMPHELVIGLAGAFWRPSGNMQVVDAANFPTALKPGTARAAWNFRIEDSGGGRVRLSTETRVQCADAGARRKFRAYWLLVRPFSGWIRMCMLRAIRDHAETAGAV